MKKFIATFAALAMLALGFVATTGTAATAGCYPPDVNTNTNSSTADIKRNTNVKTVVKVTAPNSNLTPKGKLRVQWMWADGTHKRTVKTSYNGGEKTVTGPKLYHVGAWKVVVKYFPGSCSKFKKSSDVDTFAVTRN